MSLAKLLVVAGLTAALSPSAPSWAHPIGQPEPAASAMILADLSGPRVTTPGATVGTYVHRFGRLHDLRRLDNTPYPGTPQHRFGQPDSLQVPGRFVRPDRIGPYNRRPPRLTDN